MSLEKNKKALFICIVISALLGTYTSSFAQEVYPLFTEDFDSNDNEWLLGNRARTNAHISNGVFYLESKRPKYNYSRRTEQGYIRNDQDFEIEIKIRQVKGNAERGYGLEWGGNSLDNSFYEFWLRNDGYYSIDRFDDPSRSFEDFVPWTHSGSININQYNILIVRKVGTKLIFFINGNQVFSMPYPRISGAEVGFIAPPLGAVEVDYIKVSLIGKGPKPILDRKETPNIYVLLVAIADYENNDELNDLRFTVNDVKSIANFYKSKNGGAVSPENMIMLLDQEATKSNILGSMKLLYQQANENDMIIFYYSGHGALLGRQSPKPLYLIPYDYSTEPTALHHDEIEQIFNGSKANKKLWMMDACHSGGSLPQMKGRIQNHLSSLVDKDIAIITSSNMGETSIEASSIGEGRGLFSFYLTNGLIYHSEDCDTNQNGIVSILELYNYVSRTVATTAEEKYYHQQHPQIGGKFNVQLPMAEVTFK